MVAQSKELQPRFSPKALAMSIDSTLAKSRRDDDLYKSKKPLVKAAALLNQHSSTDIIDVSKFSQNSSHIIQYVDIVEIAGRLHSTSNINNSCWVKIVTIAKDCQSSNVILMTTENGIVLKTIRSIDAGEPLEMWFTENILAMLNIPYLTNVNIQGNNRYTCHLCNDHFESPNPLKIHLALKCNRLDSSFLWTQLANEFIAMKCSPLATSLFPKLPCFTFEIGKPQQLSGSPLRSSPVPIPTSGSKATPPCSLNDSGTLSSHSLSPPNQTSPSSSIQASPPSPSYFYRYPASSPVLQQTPPLRLDATAHHSAFMPYPSGHSFAPRALAALPQAPPQAPPAPLVPRYRPSPEELAVNASQVETYYSNHAKVGNSHQCFYCGKMYSRKYGLKIHIRTHTGFKPLQCKICSRPFGDPSNLNKHIRLHSETDTPYKCHICNKLMVRKRDLERHMKSRHQKITDSVSDDFIDVVDS